MSTVLHSVFLRVLYAPLDDITCDSFFYEKVSFHIISFTFNESLCFRVPCSGKLCWCQNLANSCSFAQSHDVKAWLEKPVATVCCRIVLPCLSKTVPHTCQSSRPLGSSCGAMQTSDTAGPDLFPKLETDIQAKLDQQDQQERRKAVKQEKSWLTAFLPAVSCKPNGL